MDLRKVKKLIELVEESGIAELEVRSGDEAIRIAMRTANGAVIAPTVVRTSPAASGPIAPPAAGSFSVPSPMAGVFYRAANPQTQPFVEVGQMIHAGDILCIIESMKMMHEILAQDDGRLLEVCVENGEPIGTGETLFRFA